MKAINLNDTNASYPRLFENKIEIQNLTKASASSKNIFFLCDTTLPGALDQHSETTTIEFCPSAEEAIIDISPSCTDLCLKTECANK